MFQLLCELKQNTNKVLAALKESEEISPSMCVRILLPEKKSIVARLTYHIKLKQM